jgi:hypothetical protein
MARGWESKSVEQQQEEMADRRNGNHPSASPADQLLARKRDGLLLSRKHVTQQLQVTANPRHRQMLQQALAEVDAQLSSFEQLPGPSQYE